MYTEVHWLMMRRKLEIKSADAILDGAFYHTSYLFSHKTRFKYVEQHRQNRHSCNGAGQHNNRD